MAEDGFRPCTAQSTDGFYCLLREGHEALGEPHLSLDNKQIWKGSPGRPIRWESPKAKTHEPRKPIPAYDALRKFSAKKLTDAPDGEQERPAPAVPEPGIEPILVTSEEAKEVLKKSDELEYTGEQCQFCNSTKVVRESSCRTRCYGCGAIDGGCG
jgi:hypothetical protein